MIKTRQKQQKNVYNKIDQMKEMIQRLLTELTSFVQVSICELYKKNWDQINIPIRTTMVVSIDQAKVLESETD